MKIFSSSQIQYDLMKLLLSVRNSISLQKDKKKKYSVAIRMWIESVKRRRRRFGGARGLKRRKSLLFLIEDDFFLSSRCLLFQSNKETNKELL